MFWLVYLLVFVGLLYLSWRNFPKYPVLSVLVTVCMMLAFSPVFTTYGVHEPIVFGFPLWFLVWFVVAAVFVWIFLFYTLIRLLPGNEELEAMWETVTKREEEDK